MKKYKVTLTAEERQHLHDLIAAGKAAARKLAHARILLKADAADGGPAWPDRPDRRGPGGQHRHRRAGPPAVRRAGPGGRPGSASSRSDPAGELKLDGRAEARLIALACSAPAGGPGGVDHAAAGRQAGRAGGRGLDLRRDGPAGSEKNELKPHLKEQWCIPPEADAEFVAAMEDVLDVYHRPYDEKRPLVCLDEASKQLIPNRLGH